MINSIFRTNTYKIIDYGSPNKKNPFKLSKIIYSKSDTDDSRFKRTQTNNKTHPSNNPSMPLNVPNLHTRKRQKKNSPVHMQIRRPWTCRRSTPRAKRPPAQSTSTSTLASCWWRCVARWRQQLQHIRPPPPLGGKVRGRMHADHFFTAFSSWYGNFSWKLLMRGYRLVRV